MSFSLDFFLFNIIFVIFWKRHYFNCLKINELEHSTNISHRALGEAVQEHHYIIVLPHDRTKGYSVQVIYHGYSHGKASDCKGKCFNSKSCEVDNVLICVLDALCAHYCQHHLTFILYTFDFYSSMLAHFATSSSWHPNLFRFSNCGW